MPSDPGMLSVMVLRALGIILLSSLFYSCGSIEPKASKDQSPLDYEKIADGITNKTAKKLQKEKGLVLIGTGGQMMNDIQMMAMSFDLYREVNLEEARELLVFIVQKYLKNINKTEEIKPYLHEDPFTVGNIEIRIWLHNPDGSDLASEKIRYISVLEGKFKCRSELLGRRPFHEESYEEAVKIVNSQKEAAAI